MGLADTRAMKWVVQEMQKRTKELEKKLDIFIDNQNDLAKMTATNYLMLKAIAKAADIKEEEFHYFNNLRQFENNFGRMRQQLFLDPEVVKVVSIRTNKRGGYGAVREICDLFYNIRSKGIRR